VHAGDLLHGDVNGLLTIPEAIADRLAEQVQQVRLAERDVLDFVRRPGLTVAGLRAFQEQFRH
jgi:regulator of RNase E activity RraA